ncbi:hypothetical protein [Cellulomonas sp. KRMCY2]|uniref:hypothetical protein n=1 Tax=Cellulomonas sp. KRMCY2 TaxID=1304865 RepID=UPI00045E74DD|nr:hypothetical protein [Cellulomonas sp. KRMCY2]
MTGRRVTVASTLTVAALLLAACTPPLPVPAPDAVPAAMPPAISTEQVERILADLDVTVEEADVAYSADLLDPRLTGPARAMRATEYALRLAGDTEAITAVPPVAQTIVAPTTDTWPRTVMVITEPPEDLQAPLLLTLVQEGPRDPYRLWSWARLFPGVAVPAIAQPEVGSLPVEPDAESLAVSPKAVVEQYVDVLTSGAGSQYAASFSDDPLRAGIVATREAYAGLVVDKGSLTETYQPYESGPYSIATADGGAIVVGAVQTVTTITLDDSTLTIGDQTAALLGKQTVASNLAITWLSVVAFAVPPAGSTDPITVLGAEHSRMQVTGE